MHILLLGGTTEASRVAEALAEARMRATFSYAGRTAAPMAQPLPTRQGGFGGVDGLTRYLADAGISHVIDATHPFAAGMSANAFAACSRTATPLLRLERPAWQPGADDRWTRVVRLEDVPDQLPTDPARIFLGIGRQQIDLFARRPEHHYLLRFVDAPQSPLPLPYHTVLVARGPFDGAGDTDMLREHTITHVVCKNAGGEGARAKLDAARALGLPVLMVDRPELPGDRVARNVDEVMRWLSHGADRGV